MKTNRKGLSVVLYDNKTIAQLYSTIIFIREGNNIKLNSGGWRTRHTKNCINDLLPARLSLYQKNFEWYLYDKMNDHTIDFTDNMTFECIGF